MAPRHSKQPVQCGNVPASQPWTGHTAWLGRRLPWWPGQCPSSWPATGSSAVVCAGVVLAWSGSPLCQVSPFASRNMMVVGSASILPFPCRCPCHRVRRDLHTFGIPGGNLTLRIAASVLIFVLATLQLLPSTCLYPVLAVQPVYFWGCPPPGSWWQPVTFSLSCCLCSSAETFVLLHFLLLLFPGCSRILYFSFVLCLFLCPAGEVERNLGSDKKVKILEALDDKYQNTNASVELVPWDFFFF